MRKFITRRTLAICVCFAASCGLKMPAGEYPAARRGPQFDDYFGQKVLDPYRWLEDVDSPRTAKWIAAQKAFAAAAFSEMPERDAVRSALTQVWNIPRCGLPLKRGELLFYTANEGLQNQDVLYVASAAGGTPRVLMDPNTPAADGSVSIAGFAPSDDGRQVAYALAMAGADSDELHVRSTATGKDSSEVIRCAWNRGVSWTRDGAGFFYGAFPELREGEKPRAAPSGERLYYHRLGTDQASDTPFFEMKDHPEWTFGGQLSGDGRYVVISVRQNDKTRNALYCADLADADRPRLDAPVRGLFDGFDATYAFIGNKGPVFYVLTTLGAPKGRIVSIDASSPGPAAVATVVPQGADPIDEVACAGGKFVVSTLHDVQGRLALYGADGAPQGQIDLPEACAVTGISARAGDPEFYYGRSSFLTPPEVDGHNADTGASSVFRRPKAPVELSDFETREAFCTSPDGTRIPIFITARKGLRQDGSSAAWLHGHGGDGRSLKPVYSAPAIEWLRMGGVYAQASVRGGAEFGEEWHLSGTRLRKQNSFDDFAAAARYLVASGYTKADRLVVAGGSASGGLLVAAVINQHPDLCAAALPDEGVLDMLRYQTFPDGARLEADFGTSGDPAAFKYLIAYSPAHNAAYGVHYPAVLVTTGERGSRVSPVNSFKYAAALQAAIRTTPYYGPIVIRISPAPGPSGLGGSRPLSSEIDAWADRMGFAAHYMPPGVLSLPKSQEPSPAVAP